MHDEQKLPLLPTRAAFIRGLPESMPVQEVIERGHEIGLSINPSDVHSARYFMRQEAARKAPPPAPKVPVDAATSDVAAAVRRNYALLDSQRSDQDDEKPNGASIVNGSNGVHGNGVKSKAVLARSATVVVPGRGKTGSKARPFLTDAEIAKLEEQVRQIATRIGTDRIRDLMRELENSVRDLD